MLQRCQTAGRRPTHRKCVRPFRDNATPFPFGKPKRPAVHDARPLNPCENAQVQRCRSLCVTCNILDGSGIRADEVKSKSLMISPR